MMLSSTSAIFVEEEKQNNLDNLDKYLKSSGSMTRSQYLQLIEQTGRPYDEKKAPVAFEDLKPSVQIAIYIYNKLGNRIYGDVGMVGKDYTNLPILIEYLEIQDVLHLMDLLQMQEASDVDKSQASIKKMYDDMKKKK